MTGKINGVRFIRLGLISLLMITSHFAFAGLDEALTAYDKKDYETAFHEFHILATDGDQKSQYNIALMYLNGLGVKLDYKPALYWFTKSAEQGYVNAQYNLGGIYRTGKGADKDYTKAVYWYTKAANQGDSDAQNTLGIMYEYGEGVPKNYIQATTWFQKSADQGNELAKKNLWDIVLNRQPKETVKSNISYKDRTGKEVQLVVANGVSVVPGAIVCADLKTVEFIFHWYTEQWRDDFNNQATNGQSVLVEGKPTSAPDLQRYGCNLIHNGTSMTMEVGNVVSVVTAKLPNGKIIKGVTLPSMFH